MRRATTAHSSRSPRNLGKMRPRLTSPTPWPARPMRCRPRATDFGDSICSTRSTAPMSMPSSSELVATRHGSSPAFSSSSTFVRSSRASEPWWRARSRGATRRASARRSSSLAAASSFRRSATRSAERRLLTNTIVELCARTSSQQLGVDRRPDRVARGLAAGERLQRIAGGRPAPAGLGHRLDRHLDAQVERLARAGVDDRHLAPRADEEAADLLERVLRRAEADALRVGPPRPELRSRRSSVSARCAPRLVRATAWISSTITASTPPSISRACEVRIRYSDSGVVTRMSGGVARHRRALALGGVARADRDAHVLGADPAQRRAQVALDVVGERLQRADVDDARGRASAARLGASRSSAHRNAASVLPEPVGADSSTFSPAAIAGQAFACAGVGASKACSNHSRTFGVKLPSATRRG